MKSTGIMFKPEMVRAILSGLKTETRRAMKSQPSERWTPDVYTEIHKIVDGEPDPSRLIGWGACNADGDEGYVSRYGHEGDHLYVKEGYWDHNRPGEQYDSKNIEYRASEWLRGGALPKGGDQWKNAMFMPRAAARIHLEILDLTVQRLHDISEEQARAEGMLCEYAWSVKAIKAGKLDDSKFLGWQYKPGDAPFFDTARDAYLAYWEVINGRGSRAANPWVWRMQFKRLELTNQQS